jgi:hypothetical protein
MTLLKKGLSREMVCIRLILSGNEYIRIFLGGMGDRRSFLLSKGTCMISHLHRQIYLDPVSPRADLEIINS